MKRRSICATLALLMVGPLVPVTPLRAEPYPSRTIKLVVSLAPGGVADLVARAFAAKLAERGTSVVVENRTGAGGVVGADAVAKSPPDGYTLYLGFHATQSILPHLMPKMPYDAGKDFAPITLLATSPNVLVVHPSLPVRSAGELVAYAKANPGKVSVGTPGAGSSDHLAAEQFRQMHGIDITPVHYRGAAPAMQDLVAGHVQMMFGIVPLVREQLASGNVRALAVTSADRVAVLPQVPTLTEAGMPAIEGGPWFGLLAPAGTPRPVIEWLNAEARRAFTSPDVKSRLEDQGLALPVGTPEEFETYIAIERARWGEVIRSGKITLEQ